MTCICIVTYARNTLSMQHAVIGCRMVSGKAEDDEKPFICPMKGCKKRYKNINGVKYHARNGHRREARYVLYRMQEVT